MALEYAGGTNRNDLYAAITTRQGLLDSINTTLVAAGWTSTTTKAFVRLVFTGQPANTNTVTLNGKVYTFQTVLTNSDGNVLIGATALESYQNLAAAIRLGAGAGTKYAAATTAHTTMECPTYYNAGTGPTANPNSATSTLKVQAITAGAAGRALTASETCANMTITDASTNNDGYKWLSAKTPDGLRQQIFGFNAGLSDNPPNTTTVHFIVSDMHEVVRSHAEEPGPFDGTSAAFGFRVGLGNSTTWRVIANKYNVFLLVPGTSAELTFFHSVIVKLRTTLVPVVVTAATNATPIAITTASAHGWSTGQQVCIRNGEGNTAVNGTQTLTVTGATTATLDGTVGNGTYTASSAVAARLSPLDKVSEAIFAGGNGSTQALFRVHCGSSNTSQEYWASINAQNHRGGATGMTQLYHKVPGGTDLASNGSDWANANSDLEEPLIGAGLASGGAPFKVGQPYDMATLSHAYAIDQTATFDGHNWWNLTNNNGGSTSVAEASAFVVVP